MEDSHGRRVAVVEAVGHHSRSYAFATWALDFTNENGDNAQAS